MKVAEVMTREVQSCTPETNLATAAIQMWDADCGALPVVDDDGIVMGMITDRDICIAAATNHQDITGIKVGEVRTGEVQSCTPETSVRDALKIFDSAQVRRIPVVDKNNRLAGILSISDIVLRTVGSRDQKSVDISHADIVNTFKAICSPYAKATAAGA
jgi:CBS domain-containing protein